MQVGRHGSETLLCPEANAGGALQTEWQWRCSRPACIAMGRLACLCMQEVKRVQHRQQHGVHQSFLGHEPCAADLPEQVALPQFKTCVSWLDIV